MAARFLFFTAQRHLQPVSTSPELCLPEIFVYHISPLQQPERVPSSSMLCLNNGDLSAPYTSTSPLSRGRVMSTLSNSRRFAVGKEAEDDFLSNVSEDSDEMFDDLFNKYGKAVYKSDDL